jgi:hypothetical protein
MHGLAAWRVKIQNIAQSPGLALNCSAPPSTALRLWREQVTKKHSDGELLEWAQCLVDYAQDWDDHFKVYGKFFTQEYWYLLVRVTEASWKNEPQNVQQTKDRMDGLEGHDDRTKDDRIEQAIARGLIYKVKYDQLDQALKKRFGTVDGRSTLLLPTEILENLMRSHLSATLRKAEILLNRSRQ